MPVFRVLFYQMLQKWVLLHFFKSTLYETNLGFLKLFILFLFCNDFWLIVDASLKSILYNGVSWRNHDIHFLLKLSKFFTCHFFLLTFAGITHRKNSPVFAFVRLIILIKFLSVFISLTLLLLPSFSLLYSGKSAHLTQNCQCFCVICSLRTLLLFVERHLAVWNY